MEQLILALDSESRTRLVELARRLEPHQAEVAELWNDAYLANFGRDEHMGDDQPLQGLRDMVRFSVGRLKRGGVDGLLDRIDELGRRLEVQAFTYERMSLSLHLFERSILSVVARDWPDTDDLHSVAEVLDLLCHHVLVKLATSHFDSKLASLEALESVSEAALSTMDLDALLATVLKHVTQAVAADAGAILLKEKDGNDLVYRSVVGDAEANHLMRRVSIGEGLAGQVAATNASISVPSFLENVSASKTPGDQVVASAACGVPLRVGGQPIGVLYVSWSQPHFGNPRALQLLETMAARVTLAIGHARLYAESQLLASQLTEANRELRILDQLKSDFLSVVSHELRTPLTAILGYSELVLKGIHGELPAKPREHITTIHQNGRRLLTLINDLLDFSSIEAGRINLNMKPVRLRPLLEKILVSGRAEAGAHDIELNAVIPKGLPPVMADEQRVKQIMDHLLSNAIKFTACGGQVEVRVGRQIPDLPKEEASAGQPPETLQISVGDTGIGIPHDELERIWNRFYQVEAAATRRFGGTGMGLAVVKTLVEMHGGSVWAESGGTPGCGSTFFLTLRVAERDRDR